MDGLGPAGLLSRPFDWPLGAKRAFAAKCRA